MKKVLCLTAIVCLFSAVTCPGHPLQENAAASPEGPHRTVDSLFNIYQPYIENIGAYQPIYFLVGAEPEDSKFQISLKYQFLSPKRALSSRYPWLRGFHIAYTQTSFWDLASDSQPFDDTSYKPEIFWLSPNLFSGAGVSHVFLQTGLQHESNGRAGTGSRSTNFAYAKPMFVLYHEESRLGFSLAPVFWAYVGNEDESNPDLYKYRGYFDLELKAGWAEGAVLESHYTRAEKGDSIRFDLSYPVDRLFHTRLQIYLHAQYVNALAESLLDYKSRSRAFRFGISVVR